MAFGDLFVGVFFWQISCYILGLLCFLMLAAFVFLGKKTHAIKELKASMKGVPLCLFLLIIRRLSGCLCVLRRVWCRRRSMVVIL